MNMNEDDEDNDDNDLQLLCNSCESESDKVRIEKNRTCQNRTDECEIRWGYSKIHSELITKRRTNEQNKMTHKIGKQHGHNTNNSVIAIAIIKKQ